AMQAPLRFVAVGKPLLSDELDRPAAFRCEEGVNRRFGDIFETSGRPLRRVVLVDDDRPDAFVKVRTCIKTGDGEAQLAPESLFDLERSPLAQGAQRPFQGGRRLGHEYAELVSRPGRAIGLEASDDVLNPLAGE